MNVKKLYPAAGQCAQEPSNFLAIDRAFSYSSKAAPPLGGLPLGRYTESSDHNQSVISPVLDEKTAKGPGRSEATTAGSDACGRRESRAVRYELLSMAREILIAQGRVLELEHPSNFHRTAKCMFTPHGEVAILRDKVRGNAFYGGLVACGGVWACPVCATKVQERRRAEIASAFAWAYSPAIKLQPVMVTLTFPHKFWNVLGDLVLQQRQALKLLRYGRPWKELVSDFGYEGLIRALEITHGCNGWHPHTHEVWLVSQNITADNLKTEVLKQWVSACTRAGLLDASNQDELKHFLKHSVHVKGWCKDSDYLAKQDDQKNWGVDREMAKGATKLGKLKGLHPFGLLAKAANGDTRFGALFLEFATAMKATRSRQLFWSPGLKGRVGIGEKTDEQVAMEQSEDADVLGSLAVGDWQLVRLFRQRAQLLDAAETGGWPAVRAILERLSRRFRSGLSCLEDPVPVPAPAPAPVPVLALPGPPGGPQRATTSKGSVRRTL